MTPVLEALTDREERVMVMLCSGRGEREMAASLGVTVWTVRAHKSNIRHKLGADTMVQAVAVFVAARLRA